MRPRATLKPAILKDLLAEGKVASVRIQNVEDGFFIQTAFNGEDKTLGLVKEDRARVFKTLKSAKAHLTRFGIDEALVESPPVAPAKKRRRVAQPPGRMSEAALNAELEKALAELENGTAELIDCGPDFFAQLGVEVRARHAAEGPPITRTTVEPNLLDVMMALGGIDFARIESTDGGFRILIGHNKKEEWVGYAYKDQARIFKTLKSAKAHLTKFGVKNYSVDGVPISPRSKNSDQRPSLH